jgi:hypothetical protein
LKPLEHFYLLDEHILRFLTVKLDKKALKARVMRPPAAQSEPAPAAVEPEVPPEKSVEKVPLFDEGPEVKL